MAKKCSKCSQLQYTVYGKTKKETQAVEGNGGQKKLSITFFHGGRYQCVLMLYQKADSKFKKVIRE